MIKKDFTNRFNYSRLIREEREHYARIEVTEDLKEGGVHASDSWNYYWQRVHEALLAGPFYDLPACLDLRFGDVGPIEILSLGSGYCGHELDLARRLRSSCRIVCTDINQDLFAEARSVAADEELNLEFTTEDLNFMAIPAGRFHLIFAHASLHHVINLEHLYEQIEGGLAPGGILHIVEVVGKNRKLIWDENERLANALLDVLPNEVTGGIRLDVPEEGDGMEGIRQEEIIPLLRERFSPLFEYRHGAFMRFVCTHSDLSRRLDPNLPEGRRCLDFLIDADLAAVRHGVLEPLELWGVYEPLSRVS